MSALTTARQLLEAHECFCTPTADGGLLFCGLLGRGRVDEASAGRVRLRADVGAVADDPVEFARISFRLGPARITLRRRTPVAERICEVGELVIALCAIKDFWARESKPDLCVKDVSVGVLAAVAPRLTMPSFLRLAPPAGETVDRARATYLLVANAQLRSGKGGWLDGPGLSVDPAKVDYDILAQELFQVGHALSALGDERIADSYLELCGMHCNTQPCVPARDAKTQGGGS